MEIDDFITTMYANVRINAAYIGELFDCPENSLEQEVLWETFKTVAAKEIHKRSGGDISVFSDYVTAVAMQEAVAARWPEAYYLEMLVREGILHKFDTDEGLTYAVKERYSPILYTILTEVESSEGS